MTATRRRSTGSPTGVARKETILRAAAKVFAQKGFAAATVRDIADEAGTLSGNLYYYFESKEALVEELLVEYLDQLVIAYRQAVDEAADPVEALERLIGAALHCVVRWRHEVTILQNDWHYVREMPGIVSRMSVIEKTWLATLTRGIDEGLLRSDYEPRMIFRVAMGSIQAVIRWFDPAGRASIEDVMRVHVGVLLDGIRAQ